VDSPDVSKVPYGQPDVGQPASGTYGEKKSLSNLQADLPTRPVQPAPPDQTPPPVSPKPVTPVRSSRDSQVPGVPAPILDPTGRPGVPVNTPLLNQPEPSPQQTGSQQRLAVLDMLANSTEVTDTTREWAQMMISVLTS